MVSADRMNAGTKGGDQRWMGRKSWWKEGKMTDQGQQGRMTGGTKGANCPNEGRVKGRTLRDKD